MFHTVLQIYSHLSLNCVQLFTPYLENTLSLGARASMWCYAVLTVSCVMIDQRTPYIIAAVQPVCHENAAGLEQLRVTE
jgi:hypothetical protein